MDNKEIIQEVEKNIRRKEITLNTNNYVVMANNMILHSASNLTLNELKLLRFIIMQTEKDDNELYEFDLSVKDLAKLLQINHKDLYKRIDTMTTHIMQEVIRIGDDTNKKWIKFHWVDICRYDNGIITIKISDELKPFLIGLRGSFTRYPLAEIIQLKSTYAIRIYEILNGYMNDNNLPHADVATEISLSIEELRKATDTEKKFERPYDFKKKVIDIAIREINDKSKYHVTATTYKSGKAIKGFDFLIESQVGYTIRTTDNKRKIKIKQEKDIQMSLNDFIDIKGDISK